jgi:hypothetical protein
VVTDLPPLEETGNNGVDAVDIACRFPK